MNPDTNERQETGETTYQKSSVNKTGVSFIISMIFEQVMVCLLYGLLFDFNTDVRNSYDFDDLFLVSIMTILVLVGKLWVI